MAEKATLPNWAINDDITSPNDYSPSDQCSCADFNIGNTCYCSIKPTPQIQQRVVNNNKYDRNEQCKCTGKIRKFKTIYFGSDKATIKFYDYDNDNYIRTKCSFENVKFGQEISCRMRKGTSFSQRTNFRIIHLDGTVCSGYFDTNCDGMPEIGQHDRECGELLVSAWTDTKSNKCNDGFWPCKCNVNINNGKPKPRPPKPAPKDRPIYTPQEQSTGVRPDPFDALWVQEEQDNAEQSDAQSEILFHDNSDHVGHNNDNGLVDSKNHLYIFGLAFVVNVFVILYCLFGSQTCGIRKKKEFDDNDDICNASSSFSDKQCDWDGSIEYESDSDDGTDVETD